MSIELALPTSAEDRIAELLRPQAPFMAKRAVELGLTVDADGEVPRPIPLSASPVILGRGEIDARRDDAALIAAAAAQVSAGLLASSEREAALAALSPVEQRLLQQRPAGAVQLATLRVDGLDSEGGAGWQGIELNSTIPAMQAYSDIAVQVLIEAMGRARGLRQAQVDAAIAANRGNAAALLAALQQFAAARGVAAPERIGLLCRPQDAQIGELRFLARRFGELGVEAAVLHPDQLQIGTSVRALGRRWPLLYRHYFANRLDGSPNAALEHLFADPTAHGVVLANPIAPDLESKRLFALLSEIGDDDQLALRFGIGERQRAAIRRRIPWTRLLRHGPAQTEAGVRVADLPAYLAEQPATWVLKRSEGYGGRGVLLGMEEGSPEFAARSNALFGQVLSWQDLLHRAADEPPARQFVVQARVEPPRRRQQVCTAQGAVATDWFVDYSAFASLLPEQPAWTGVCRGSIQRVVNIVSGGGIIPLLSTELATELLAGAYGGLLK